MNQITEKTLYTAIAGNMKTGNPVIITSKADPPSVMICRTISKGAVQLRFSRIPPQEMISIIISDTIRQFSTQ
jgi:hypothetical protein